MLDGKNQYPDLSEYSPGPTAIIKASKWFGPTGIRLLKCNDGVKFLQKHSWDSLHGTV